MPISGKKGAQQQIIIKEIQHITGRVEIVKSSRSKSHQWFQMLIIHWMTDKEDIFLHLFFHKLKHFLNHRKSTGSKFFRKMVGSVPVPYRKTKTRFLIVVSHSVLTFQENFQNVQLILYVVSILQDQCQTVTWSIVWTKFSTSLSHMKVTK